MRMLTEEQLHKRFHYMYFTLKVISIGIAVFLAFQTGMILFLPTTEHAEYSEKFVGHYYCGTFFIEVSDKDFASEETFDEFKKYETPTVVNISTITLVAASIVGLCLILRKADKGKLYTKGSSTILLASAGCYFTNSLIMEIYTIVRQNDVRPLYKGILAGNSYYPQLHTAFAFPFILLCAALLFKRNELIQSENSVKKNNVALRISTVSLSVVGGGFILWRFIIRVYEMVLLFIHNGENMAVRIPFYSEMLDLPSSAAVSSGDYINLVTFRFAKDLPVFVASALCIFLFVKMLLSYTKGEINTPTHARYTRIMIIALAVSSVLFNGLGIIEVLMLNNNFTGAYGGAYYTIGVRANCEPLIYAGFIYVFGLFEKAYTTVKA